MIVIKSKKDGFRRCGVAHRLDEITYPDDFFDENEELALMEEPMLTVTSSNSTLTVTSSNSTSSPYAAANDTYDSIKNFSVPEIKDILKSRDIKFRQNDTKYILWQKLKESL